MQKAKVIHVFGTSVAYLENEVNKKLSLIGDAENLIDIKYFPSKDDSKTIDGFTAVIIYKL